MLRALSGGRAGASSFHAAPRASDPIKPEGGYDAGASDVRQSFDEGPAARRRRSRNTIAATQSPR